jgi:hypothetical protein
MQKTATQYKIVSGIQIIQPSSPPPESLFSFYADSKKPHPIRESGCVHTYNPGSHLFGSPAIHLKQKLWWTLGFASPDRSDFALIGKVTNNATS